MDAMFRNWNIRVALLGKEPENSNAHDSSKFPAGMLPMKVWLLQVLWNAQIHSPRWQWCMIPLSAQFPHMLVVHMMDNFQKGPWADLHKQETFFHDHSCEKKSNSYYAVQTICMEKNQNMYHTISFPSLWFIFYMIFQCYNSFIRNYLK